MTNRSHCLVLGLALCAGFTLQSARAASTVTQTFEFPEEVTSWQFGSDQSHYFYFPESYQTNVAPFDTTLGVLETVTLTWTFAASFSGFASNDPSGGGVGLSFGGNVYIGGNGYSGGGSGGGHGAGPDGTLSMTSSPMSIDKEFTAAGAGVTYNPAIWPVLNGSSPWPAEFDNNVGSYFMYNDVASGTFTSTLGLEVTYHYTPSPVPEPAGVFGTIGLLSGGLLFRRRKPAA